MKDYPVFVGANEPCVPPALRVGSEDMGHMQSCRIPSLISVGQAVAAFCDKANCGADWGFIELAVRRSQDSGDSFKGLETIFTPPVRIAPVKDSEYTSAFAIDPVTVLGGSGEIIMLFDFYPECKGLHDRSLLKSVSGYTNIGGKEYLTLYDDSGGEFTVREKGIVYDSQGNPTKYYLPTKHNPKYNFQTVGDMYRCEGEPEFSESYPPLFPESCRDIYVGNIFLSHRSTEGERVVKHQSENGLYPCVETDSAPMRAAVTMFLWMMKSYDKGKTWTQPVDITPQIKLREGEDFIGTGPGSGLRLSSGRIIIPLYNIGRAFVIFSDDNGESWTRRDCKNIDECQLVQYRDGTVACFGRPNGGGEIPYSLSHDGGEAWQPASSGIYSVMCQHSVLRVPESLYAHQMDKGRDYIICLRPTGHGGRDKTRTEGLAALGQVQEDYSIRWLCEMPVKTDETYSLSPEYRDFFAYSSMAALPDGSIGVLYEAFPGGYIAFTKFPLKKFFD